MDLFEVIKKRRSVRAFEKRVIEEEKINVILEACNAAPSAGNLQAYEIYLIRSEEKLRELAQAALGQDFIAGADFALVFCAHPRRSAIKYGNRGSELYCVQDATIASAYAQLAATALGLGCVWVGAFDDARGLQVIGAPQALRPIAIIPMGYSAELPQATPRRGVNRLIHKV